MTDRSDPVDAPRPPTVDDLARMLADAEKAAGEETILEDGDPWPRRRVDDEPGEPASAAENVASEGDPARVSSAEGTEPDRAPPAANTAGGGLLQPLFTGLLWIGVAVAATAAVYIITYSGQNLAIVLAALSVVLAAAFILAGALGVFSPTVVAGLAVRRAVGRGATEAAQLAGADMLAGLGLTEKVLDADADPRLVARRDGVVVYANKAYFDLAAAAGVIGGSGLPPRIDRLFSQQGEEATKVFRLCRAASAAHPAEEVLQQTIGLERGGERRRFMVTTSPIVTEGDAARAGYASWRLRELPAETDEADMLAASYADYVRPVFALERTGAIAWTNAAMRERLGLKRGAARTLDDIVLGETGEVVRHLWALDGAPTTAMVRVQGGEPMEGEFRAFRRGGVGEGFACVDLAVDEPVADETPTMSGDVAEAPFGVAIIEGELNRDAKIAEANRAFLEAFEGAKKGGSLAPSMPEAALEKLAAELKRKGGAPRPIDAAIGEGPSARAFALYARPIKRRRGAYGARRTFLYSVEVTERKRMEEDYAQDQKLKAIGNIAGEVAHDFNNLLQVVLTTCEELLHRHPAGDPAYSDLLLIRQNSQRAANLTRQLLAYSRKQTLTSRVLSLTDLLIDISQFLDRAVGQKVKLELVNGRGLPPVKVDRTQLETSLMNLVVNARDAMAPDGGTVAIRTQLVSADALEQSPVPNIGGQDYVMIEVADTGPGVPPEIMKKIFDPFFTTKAEGKGTGLGLSTVHGVIGQMGGEITVENAAEGGAVFRIYLPAQADFVEEEPEAPAAPPDADYSGTGRILVVDDEAGVRLVVNNTIKQQGYEVSVAEDGVEGLEILEGDRDFDLIITDVMMPEVDGPTLVKRAREAYGLSVPVIFMSGYAEAAVREQVGETGGALFIQKPFSKAELSAKVREAIHGRAA